MALVMSHKITTKIYYPKILPKKQRKLVSSACRLMDNWDELNLISIEKWGLERDFNNGNICILPNNLYHRLSDEMIGDKTSLNKLRHSPIIELKTAAMVQSSFNSAVKGKPEQFLELLQFIHINVCASGHNFRSCRTVSGRDAWLSENGYIEYLDYKQIKPALLKLWLFFLNNTKNSKDIGFVNSIVLYTSLLSIHPFSDGNGRVARTILCCSLSYTFSKRIFIPEANLSSISRAGILLAKREAHILGNWIPIIDLFCNIVSLLNDLRSHYFLTKPEADNKSIFS